MDVDLPRHTEDAVLSRPWASLSYSGFRLIFWLSLFATTAQQMRQTQTLYQVYELSGSALQLGLTGALILGCAIGGTLTLGCWYLMPGLPRFGL